MIISENTNDSSDEHKRILLQHENSLEYKVLVEFEESLVGQVELVE